ncbi:stage II sporulation protein E [Roseiarcus fermentans]|uniref:Stage II sporulation protein E n=1 Tax=Roseiarcus fermentans TaxID=1473586 RepID=A0A366FU19_9HYPH|nr:SpoIIE family protein phosphatase [Roseiarcus fermentans]RBP17540.1 stage II sporulation protein E [Roseiarcus fermentans]
MTAAPDVGGDRCERLALDDGRVAVGVGDVCGKGVPAALFTGITKTLIRISLRQKPDLLAAIRKADAYLVGADAAELFATLLYAAFDPRATPMRTPPWLVTRRRRSHSRWARGWLAGIGEPKAATAGREDK